jgi:tyrosine-protein phosphatase YwqE
VRARALVGGEVAETALPGLADEELRAASLGGAGLWILLEPAPGPLGDDLHRHVDDLVARGFRPLIAHPERHLDADAPARLAALVEAGALVQATAQHVADAEEHWPMWDLARAGLIHVLGSDAHSSRGGREVRLTHALERLRQIGRSEADLAWIARTAPDAIVRGEVPGEGLAPIAL